MPPNQAAHSIDAFYAIGRNVVSFQRLEQILKQLALFAPIRATSKTLQSEVEKQKARAELLTLGRGVKEWIKSEFHTTESKQGPPLDQQIVISFGFELRRPPEYFAQLSAELESLAQERNRLIHLDLAQFNFEDEADCKALSLQLNAQNDRIIRMTKFLGPLLAGMKELARLIASDQDVIQDW